MLLCGNITLRNVAALYCFRDVTECQEKTTRFAKTSKGHANISALSCNLLISLIRVIYRILFEFFISIHQQIIDKLYRASINYKVPLNSFYRLSQTSVFVNSS